MLDRVTLTRSVVGTDIGQRTADHAAHRNDCRDMGRPLLGQVQVSVPRAGLMMMPATLCSRIDRSTCAWRAVSSFVFARIGDKAELKERVLDPRRELGEEGVVQVAHDHPDQIG